MKSVDKNSKMDLTTGPILKKLVLYSVPFIFSNILQILFNIADIAVLGIFTNDNAVAAVGANTALTNLVVSLFVGLSIGSNVALARYIGAKRKEEARKTVGTSILLALISGFILLLIGVPLAPTFLKIMDCDEVVFDQAVIYLRIYFLGMPIMMLYNFTASILRAAGDSKRPLIFLAIGGVINVLLNVFFVVVCKMTVEGVAIATVISQLIASLLSLATLIKGNGEFAKLKFRYLRIYKHQLKQICMIGIPSSLQGLAFGISNVLIQSTVNSFGAVGMSANTAAQQYDAIVYNAGNAISLSCMAFIGQNIGAKNIDRVKKSIYYSLLFVFIVQFSLGLIFVIFSKQLTGIILTEQKAIDMAYQRMFWLCVPYFLCGCMEVCSNSIRAMGRPIISMFTSVLGAVIFRIVWLEITFYFFPYFSTIYISYFASWVFTNIVYLFMVPKVYKSVKKDIENFKI